MYYSDDAWLVATQLVGGTRTFGVYTGTHWSSRTSNEKKIADLWPAALPMKQPLPVEPVSVNFSAFSPPSCCGCCRRDSSLKPQATRRYSSGSSWSCPTRHYTARRERPP